jgi:hypothetical protein
MRRSGRQRIELGARVRRGRPTQVAQDRRKRQRAEAHAAAREEAAARQEGGIERVMEWSGLHVEFLNCRDPD